MLSEHIVQTSEHLGNLSDETAVYVLRYNSDEKCPNPTLLDLLV